MRKILTVPLLAVAALAPTAAAAAPTVGLSGTPKLYVVKNTGLGRPVAYVVFKTSKHVHQPHRLVSRVKSHSGRTYSVAGNCYRSSFINEKADGKPIQFLTSGSRYKVDFRLGATESGGNTASFATRTLTAHALAKGTLPPGC